MIKRQRATLPAGLMSLLAGLIALLTVGVGGAAAATTLLLDPPEAAPGTRVVIINACLGVTDNPPAKMKVAFVSLDQPDLSPNDPSVPKSVAKASGNTYVFVVPAIPPGPYDVRLECQPGDWRTNLAEGIGSGFTVLRGGPGTSTTATGLVNSDPGQPLRLALIIGLGMLGGLAALRRGTAGR